MLYTVAGVAMIVLWFAGVFFFQAPAWIHLLLSVGLALAIYGIVRPAEQPKKP